MVYGLSSGVDGAEVIVEDSSDEVSAGCCEAVSDGCSDEVSDGS